MRIIKRELAFEGDHLRLVNKYFKTDAGKKGIWETVESKNTHNRGAVVVDEGKHTGVLNGHALLRTINQ